MHLSRLIPVLLVASLLACGGAEDERTPTLLVPVYFYQGHSIGKESPPTGLQASRDGGRNFESLTWPELITNSVSVGGDGRWIYLACGNGVMVSRDAGKSFRLTGGIRLAEVQKVAIDRRDPARAWVASAYGVFETRDGGDTWTAWSLGFWFRFCTDIRQDPVDPETLWVASDRGMFKSPDGGNSLLPAFREVGVRRVLPLPGRVLAATDGCGLMESTDGGGSFHRVPGPPDVVFCIAADPRRPEVLLAGSMKGLSISRDGGKTWTRSRKGLPEGFFVYGVLPDPDDEKRILVCGNDGVHESTDGGATFSRLGFESALVQDLTHAALPEVPRDGPADEPGVLGGWEGIPRPPEHRPEKDEAFEERRQALQKHFRDRAPKAGKWPGWATAAAEIASGRGTETLFGQLRELLAEPQHSMFFSLPLMGLYLHAKDHLPEDLRDRIREVMTTNPVYRGDTENHWVMHYTALLLAAQTWPETPASAWSMGRETWDLYSEACDWLMHWARLTADYGQGEFDSPNYFFMYLTPMLLLYDFAKEPVVRQLAGMMLDLLLADYLTESLEGAWCGGHSRIIGREVEKTRTNRVAVLHHLYGGGIPRPEQVQEWAGFAALSSYRPPSCFPAMANRREPCVLRERKRVRNVIRFGEELNPPVYEVGYSTPLYHLGSLQGGILQPIQQHTWDVTWLGSAENSTLFTVHPSVSARELGMFFPEEIHALTRTITAQKGVYGSPDKIISASPWEKVDQRENVLLALYSVPEGERFPQVSLYWPDCLERTEEGGWLFGRDGEFWVGVYPTGEGEWEEEDGWRRLRCPAGSVGFVVVTRPCGEGALRGDFEGFRKEVLEGPTPKLEGEGEALTLAFGGRRLVWGGEREFPDRVLFEGPFLNARTGTGVIRMTDGGGVTRILDFNDFTITEE